MSTYVLTPENTEIKISYRGLIPLIIIKSSLFDGKTLSKYDNFDNSAIRSQFQNMSILAPVIGVGWQRRYKNTIGGETYYHGILKTMGDGADIDSKAEGCFFGVSPSVNIDDQRGSEFSNSVTVHFFMQAEGIRTPLLPPLPYTLTIPTRIYNPDVYVDDGIELMLFYKPEVMVFVDSNDNYIFGYYRKNEIRTYYKAPKPEIVKRTEYHPDFDIYISNDSDIETEAHQTFMKALYASKETDPNNPYSGGGTSGPGGGGGSFSGDTEPIDIPDLPSISAVDAGFITIYKPTLDELRSLSKYLWSDLFSLDSFKKLFADPMDCILGLNIMPFGIASAGKANVYVGNMNTGISMTLAQQQYVAVDCGSVKASEYSGSFFDYSPHTKYNIYLPYIGIEPLDADEITGKDIRVVYHIDILTGSLICYVKVGNAVMYEYQGSCGQTIPINGSDFTRVFVGAVQIAGNVAGMVSTGGASAGAIAGGLLSSTSTAAGMKPNIEKSGSLSGAGGFLGNQKPFIIKETPRQCMPLSQQKYTGFPSYQTQRLGSLRGYTEVESVNLSGIPANDSELSEIESLLKGGVYL